MCSDATLTPRTFQMTKSALLIPHLLDTWAYSPYTDLVGDVTAAEWLCDWVRSAYPATDLLVAVTSDRLAKALSSVTERAKARSYV